MISVMIVYVLYIGILTTLDESDETGISSFEAKSFEDKREEVLIKMNMAIEHAKKEGKYKCCIHPDCTMCFLGHWIWDDGTCDCDGMIAVGEWDKVCPECKTGIEQGKCISTQPKEECVVPKN